MGDGWGSATEPRFRGRGAPQNDHRRDDENPSGNEHRDPETPAKTPDKRCFLNPQSRMRPRGEQETVPSRFECLTDPVWVRSDDDRILVDEIAAEHLLRQEPKIPGLEAAEDLPGNLRFLGDVLQRQAGTFAQALQLFTECLRVVGWPLHCRHHSWILSLFAGRALPFRAEIRLPIEPHPVNRDERLRDEARCRAAAPAR